MATCLVFQNRAGQAIEILNDLIKKNGLNITEQVLGNLFAFYEVFYPSADRDTTLPNILTDRKTELVRICAKRSKDAVRASTYLSDSSATGASA